MAPASRNDPFLTFNFAVEIDGVSSASFAECSGLVSEIEVIEYRVGNDPSRGVRKLMGLTKYSNIVLKRGLTTDRDLWNWHRENRNGAGDRRNGAVVILDETGTAVARWTFREGWISKWEGPDLDARSNEVAIETIEITHEGLEFEAS